MNGTAPLLHTYRGAGHALDPPATLNSASPALIVRLFPLPFRGGTLLTGGTFLVLPRDEGEECPPLPGKNVPRGYISRERMDRSANARTVRGASPRTRTAAAEMHRAREKAVRGGRGTGISPCAGSMYM